MSGDCTHTAGHQLPHCIAEDCQVPGWTAQTMDMGGDHTMGSSSHMSARWFADAVKCWHYTASVIGEWMSRKHWGNDNDFGIQKYSQKNLSHCHFAYHKPHMDWPGTEPRLLQSQANSYPPDSWCDSKLAVGWVTYDTQVSLSLSLSYLPPPPFQLVDEQYEGAVTSLKWLLVGLLWRTHVFNRRPNTCRLWWTKWHHLPSMLYSHSNWQIY